MDFLFLLPLLAGLWFLCKQRYLSKKLTTIVAYCTIAAVGIAAISLILQSESLPINHQPTTVVNPHSITVSNSTSTIITQYQSGGQNIINEQPPQRHLNTQDKGYLIHKLENATKLTISVYAEGGNLETNTFASEIEQFLSSKGFNVNAGWGNTYPPTFGVHFVGPDGHGNYEIDVGPQS
jgi:hypothetical protein